VTEKGKPFERVGRKAIGLNFVTTKHGSKAARHSTLVLDWF